MNLTSGKYLSMDDQERFCVDEMSDKGARFVLRLRQDINDDSNKSFTLEKVPEHTSRDF